MSNLSKVRPATARTQVDGNSRGGGIPCVLSRPIGDRGVEPERAAKRGTGPEGAAVRVAIRADAARRRAEPDLAAVSERIANGGVTGQRSDGTRILGGVADGS